MTDLIILPPGVGLDLLTCAEYEIDSAKWCTYCQLNESDNCQSPIARLGLECNFCHDSVIIDFPNREIADATRIDKAVLEHLKICLDYGDYQMEQGKIDHKGGRY